MKLENHGVSQNIMFFFAPRAPNTNLLLDDQKAGYMPLQTQYGIYIYTAIELNTVKQQCQRNLPVSTFNKEVEKYLHYTQFPFAVAFWLTNGAGGRGSLFVCKCQGAGAHMAKPQSSAAWSLCKINSCVFSVSHVLLTPLQDACVGEQCP